MDKKTEIALAKRRRDLLSQAAAPAVDASPPDRAGWWMYHGDPRHTGYVAGGDLNAETVGSDSFTTLFTIPLGGSVLSVPAIVDGEVYVGLANSLQAHGGNGGALHKIDIETGDILVTFHWDLGNDVRDIHSFTGMGCTPAVIDGHVYFGAFNGKFYCLDRTTLNAVWITDLRNADADHNQPITNDAGVDMSAPAAVIWTSPVPSADGTKLYVGCGEGENPELFSFVFCLDAASGHVVWIYCTNKYSDNENNQPNVLPAAVVDGPRLRSPFSAETTPPIVMGCSVWGAIAYDSDLHRIYCPTGNQQPEPNDDWTWDGKGEPPPFKPELPSPGYSNGILSLDADTGKFCAFFQVPKDSNYRPSDTDIDVGGSPTIFMLNEKKVVGFGCKNGSFFILDAGTLKLVNQRQMLPLDSKGKQIETVDAHPSGQSLDPQVPNSLSNKIPGENFSGVFNTGAVYPGSTDGKISPRIFFGMGGPNYHSASPGIDYESTPFMRAIDLDSPKLADAWPMDEGDPPKYKHTSRYESTTGQTIGMYASAGESGLSSPAIVNDVVFCTTSKVSIYAFRVSDGSLLWSDDLGSQTSGYNGGYGYSLGPAICGDYVVAGGLIFGRDGGVLKIYGKKKKPAG